MENGKVLRNYFENLPTREEVLIRIRSSWQLWEMFDSWSEEEQNTFLDFCTGVKGMKMLYDGFFKELMSPELHPERLEWFLSLLLGEKVEIYQILQNDSTRLADESALLITDIVVRLADKRMVNVEIQRIGYMFPGQRLACYSSDMLLRQYKWVKNRKNKEFTYKDIKTVYTIVLFEKSTKEFKKIDKYYIHHGKQEFDTGLKLDLLQEFILIPLDIFKKNTQNKPIETELEAWLAFFSYDDPEKIIELIEAYPIFKEMYEEAYEICRNIEGVMGLFSKELRQLDKNTERYMIEVMQEEIEEEKRKLKEVDQKLNASEQQLYEKNQQIEELRKRIAELEKEKS